MNRRRVLRLVAAAALTPLAPGRAGAAAGPATYRGTAMGADVSITLMGRGADAALAGVPALLERYEGLFSLYRQSELTALNARGGSPAPSPEMTALLALCDRLHAVTGGLFDPTVQPLWRALAEGGDAVAAARLVGWRRVALSAAGVRLGTGQALTLNGIAQGFVADLLAAHLDGLGFTRRLVDTGEIAASGGPWSVGIEDPAAGTVAVRHVTDSCLAVSSPGAMTIGGRAHILHPRGRPPLWSTVAVEAASAAIADGLSTALVFLDRPAIARLMAEDPAVLRVTLVAPSGDVMTL